MWFLCLVIVGLGGRVLADSASCEAEGLVVMDAICTADFQSYSGAFIHTHGGFLSISQGAF